VVREARCAARLSQRQLAAKLDKAASHVALIERGQRRIDALELYRMAKAFGLPPAELFGLITARLDTLQERIDRA
jgi:transcriptional regulator with XRE-family HTH domain